ncbi:MAG TPA: 5'/3'-nucleotidase SurE [Acidimicrobiia bacterium]|jgi:5'-nucleotidase
MRRRALAALAAVLLGTTVLAGTTPGAGAAPKKPEPLRILVTNDDGYAAPGIDAVVEALRKLPDVKVTVIAPAENKSGTGSSTTPGQLTTSKVTTVSGYPAIAVAGFPADTVIYALEQGGLKKKPNVVISGINQGQNIGLAVDLSGTVGAAKAAAARGIPALAVSQGVRPDAEPDYKAGVARALRWFKDHRKALTPKKGKKVEVVLDNLNVPSCSTGKVRGLVEVPVASSDVQGFGDPQDCSSTLTNPANDIEAFKNGYATITELPVPTG